MWLIYIIGIAGLFVTPLFLVLGWWRWWKNPSALSFFVLCSVISQGISSLTAVIFYSYMLNHLYPDWPFFVLKTDFLIEQYGWLLPVVALLLACLGLWQKHALRTFAVVSSISLLGLYGFIFLSTLHD